MGSLDSHRMLANATPWKGTSRSILSNGGIRLKAKAIESAHSPLSPPVLQSGYFSNLLCCSLQYCLLTTEDCHPRETVCTRQAGNRTSARASIRSEWIVLLIFWEKEKMSKKHAGLNCGRTLEFFCAVVTARKGRATRQSFSPFTGLFLYVFSFLNVSVSPSCLCISISFFLFLGSPLYPSRVLFPSHLSSFLRMCSSLQPFP